LRDTRIINRPVHIEGRRVWVNPGLAPGFIAGRAHVTLHAYNVRPRVFGGTGGVEGAVTVRRDELRNKGDIRRVAPVTIQRTTTAIAPTTNVPPPKPLNKGEHGVLGSHPPRAAQGTVTPQPQPQVQPQTEPKPGAAGPPPKGPATIQQHNAPAPTVTPTTPSAPPKEQPPERREERRVVPPGGGAQPEPNVVHPVTPAPPPPKQPTPSEHTLPPAAHAPPPPQVHAPPPPHAPPPAAVHTPPPPKGPPPKKPPDNKPEPLK
jgi:hypothetical protein